MNSITGPKLTPDSIRGTFNLKTGLLISVALISSLLQVSCFPEEEPEGFGDAFIVVENTGQDTLKGLSLHAFSYSEFMSVTANLSSSSIPSYTLSPYRGYKQDFIWNMPLNQYSKTLPPAGDYTFNAVFSDGQSKVFYDKLTSDYIQPPVIKLCQYVTAVKRVDVEWGEVSKADVYNVKLLALDDSLLFVSDVYNSNITNYSFSESTPGWQSTVVPATGENVKVEVSAYLLEKSNSSLNELQAVSKSRKTITWGKAN